MNLLKNSFKPTSYQKKILEILVRKIESSKTYSGSNKVNQSFVCTPADVYNEYYSDYADIDIIETINTEISELMKYSLIEIKYSGKEIEKIIGIFEKYNDYCKLIGIKGKREEANAYRQLLIKYKGLTNTLDNYCEKQMSILDSKRVVTGRLTLPELKWILECIRYIETNTDEIMERELSIELFSDSKVFNEHYKDKVCTIMKNFGNYADTISDETDKKIINSLILSKNSIVSNPTYIYFKGDGEIVYNDGSMVCFSKKHPFAISSRDIPNISHISTSMLKVMTIENLTSFNRVNSDDTFLIFLSGYNNRAKSDFLKKIAKYNSVERWLHFGDIDSDGFYILEHLRESSGLDIDPYKMSIEELKKYSRYVKPLEKQDKVKAASLISNNKYSDIMDYMLENNCKLEQEIISWKDPDIVIS